MSDLNSLSTQPQTAASKDSNASLWLFQNGLFMIGAGLLFLVSGTFFRSPNWWAIFILIPATALLWGAWMAHHFSKGAFNLWVRLHLSSGLFLLVLALIFVFNLDWRIAWPLMIILPGSIMFMNGFTHPHLRFGTELASAANLQFWTGGSLMLLGLTFLLNQLGVIHLQTLFGSFHWWGVFILMPGIGFLVNAVAVYRVSGARHTASNYLATGVLLCIEAGAELIGISWRLHFPVALTLCGLALFITNLRRN
jgi:hypothetical protein